MEATEDPRLEPIINAILEKRDYYYPLLEVFRGKNSKEYLIFGSNPNQIKLSLNAHRLVCDVPDSVGYYSARSMRDPICDHRNFLELPDVAQVRTIWEPYILVYDKNDRNNGLATELVRLGHEEFQVTKGLFVACFTEDGKKLMLPKFLKQGYQRTRVKYPDKVPYSYQEFTDWMYYDYGET